MSFARPKEQLQALFGRPDTLLVTRSPGKSPKPPLRQPGIASDYLQPYDDIFIAMLPDGTVQAFNGHVDLGTGVRTALAQVVAEELDIDFGCVDMVLGHTSATPNQGPTIASATLQISAVPLRQAAAQARHHLVAKAAKQWGVDAQSLSVSNGLVSAPDGRSAPYRSLLKGEQIRLEHNAQTPTKPASRYTLIGQSIPRVDIPAKATGQLVFVHDVRVPGMWHARVVRPPYVGRDSGDFVGKSLISIDESSVAHIASGIRVVAIGDFVAVAAQREEHAIKAAKALKVTWQPPPDLPDLSDLDAALRSQPYQERLLLEQEQVGAETPAGALLERSYVWPYQMHASVGPSCSVADYQEGHVRVWSGSQNPHMLRVELSRLLELDEGEVEIIRMEASGCYGRNCADDVCADAALVSRAIGKPVRVQLSREQEHGWEPKGSAQLIDVVGGLDERGELRSYDFTTRYPSNDAPTLALLLTGATSAEPRVLEMGDRTAVPPYAYPNMRIACHDMAAIVRSAWLRGVSALPNSFAHDSFIDELAAEAGQDPVDFRVRNLKDERARDVILETARHAGWQTGRQGSRGRPDAEGMLHGRGVAYARYTHSRFPGFGASWNAWVIDLSVNAATGRVTVTRVVVGQDTGMIVNPDGVRHQIRGNIIQMLSRTLKEEVAFNKRGVVDLEWGAYPIISFTDIPPIEVVLVDRQDEPPMGAGESSSVPAPAAIANALFDATGQRFRTAPFTPDKILQALEKTGAAEALA
ncbi:xanthine dehydrogenase family protein molybdopterin-binding subunit [Pusillimonas sp.]|uniref:xanthine dehydrogenase family protein molybdopterin-binding subunit n=1 Tax=Pusillimonas sp. TaxID=3040095 RepID=UPI0029B97AF4|nr:molybdopterin cofactor-binding domain-containing protein [Pusillimonas sp.]MDX3893426.1 molybdopterin-dependent oxidoreductase [Pusillimonas sp.]